VPNGDENQPPWEQINLAQLPGEWWHVRDTSERRDLEDELRRECSDGHVLSGVPVVAAACRKLRKDVIYWIPTQSSWAWVHLTGRVEADSRWPRSELYESWSALVVDNSDEGTS
jgi:hypothetical protein